MLFNFIVAEEAEAGKEAEFRSGHVADMQARRWRSSLLISEQDYFLGLSLV